MPKKPLLSTTGYIRVSDETGRVQLNTTGFQPIGRNAWAFNVWTDRKAAELNTEGGDRIIKVQVIGLE